MTTALILEILGVDRQVILEDYLKTNLVNLPKAARIRDQLLPTHGEAFADSVYHAFLAEERYLCAAWEAMGEDYLHRELSLSEEQMEQFRKRVLLSR